MMTSRVYDSRFRLAVLGLTGLLTGAIAAHAQFQLVNDFENGMGTTTFENSEVFGVGTAGVVADPFPTRELLGNQVLTYRSGTAKGNTARLLTPIPVIENDSVGTVFLRWAVDQTDGGFDAGFMVSPEAAPTGHGDSAAILVTNPAGQLRYYDGSIPGYITVTGGETRADKTWYNAWFVIDTTTNTSSLYLQGGQYATQTLVAEDLAFRPSAEGDTMQNLLLLAYAGPDNGLPAYNGVVYLDDIMVDPAAENLTTPALPALTMAINRAAGAITIDGVMDSNRYSSVLANVARKEAATVVDGPDDIRGLAYGAWDDTGLYFFINVIDDVVSSDSPAQNWNDDVVELFFDPNNSKSTTGADKFDDFKIVLHPQADDTIIVSLANTPNPPTGLADLLTDMAAGYATTDTGYAVEVFIPIEAFGDVDIASGVLMGFDIQINDDDGVDTTNPPDGTGERSSIVVFSGLGNLNQNPQNWGNLLVRDDQETFVPVTSATITIDGIREDAYNTSFKNQSDGRWAGTAAPLADSSFEFSTLLDAENLYLFVNVADTEIWTDSPTQSWNDDGLEIFIDGNNSKGGAFDGVDDIKFWFRLLADNELEWDLATGNPTVPPAGTTKDGVEVGHVRSDTGWTIEVKIPVEKFKFTVEPGAVFGLDIAMNDDDDGTNRDGILSWSGMNLNNSTNTYGTAYVWGKNEGTILQADSAPAIDGTLNAVYGDNWNYANRTPGNNVHPIGSDARVWWVGVYDLENLYFYIDVIDDDLSVDTGDPSYNNDSVEIFIDAQGNSTGSPTGPDDLKLVFVPQLDGTLITAAAFPTAGKDITGVEAAYKATAYGWAVEAKVPFARVGGLVPNNGWQIGFDIQFNDDDFGGPRDSMITWSGISNLNANGQDFGVVTLVGDDLPTSFAEAIGATDAGDDWYDSWFGAFYEVDGLDGWVYHEGFGWVHVGSVMSTDSGFWFYSNGQAEWGFTSEAIFPSVYFEGLEWVSYYLDDETGAWIWHYSDSEWHPLP